MPYQESLAALEAIAAMLHTEPEPVPSGAVYVSGLDPLKGHVSVRIRQETPAVTLIQAHIVSGAEISGLQLLNPEVRWIERPGESWIRIAGSNGTFSISPQLGAHISHNPQQGL